MEGFVVDFDSSAGCFCAEKIKGFIGDCGRLAADCRSVEEDLKGV
jgi:hypothetical protein